MPSVNSLKACPNAVGADKPLGVSGQPFDDGVDDDRTAHREACVEQSRWFGCVAQRLDRCQARCDVIGMARPSVRPERHDHVGLELIDHRPRGRGDDLQRLRGETPVAEIQTRDVVHPELGHGLVEFLQTDGT